MDPALSELVEGESSEEIESLIKLREPQAIPAQVRPIARFGSIITCRVRRGDIRQVWEHPDVQSFKAPRSLELDGSIWDAESAADVEVRKTDQRRSPELVGEGQAVILGFADVGCDFAHPNLRHPDGSTRLLALWDQSSGDCASANNAPYGYGRIHNRQAIDNALKSDNPYTNLGYHPAKADPNGLGAHGTLVMDIAAGNGQIPGSPLGIAPKADLVFVHVNSGMLGKGTRLGDCVRLLEAMDFIRRVAANVPFIINVSLGRRAGSHDGLSLVEQGMDNLLLEAPGRAIVISCGNYYASKAHSSGELRPGQQRVLHWQVDPADTTPNELEIFYSGRDVFGVELVLPGESGRVRVVLGDHCPIKVGDCQVGHIYHRMRDPNTGDHHVDIFLKAGAPRGLWQVVLTGQDVIDGKFHAWVERDAAGPHCDSRFDINDVDPMFTTGTICNGLRTLAVGAYDPNSHNEIAPFSSSGPTRDFRQKPDLIAPGVKILGARSAPSLEYGPRLFLTRASGTSFAAPYVSGTVALMFEAAGRPLSIQETRKLLLESCVCPESPDISSARYGNGRLDIERAVQRAAEIAVPSANPKDVAMNEIPNSQQPAPLEDFVSTDGIILPEDEFSEATITGESWENTFHRIASDITGVFEGGKTDSLNTTDKGIVSYGKHQASLASGALYKLLKHYVELSSSKTAKQLTKYLTKVANKDVKLQHDTGFLQLLKQAALEPEMNQAQEETFATEYWIPAKKSATAAGIRSALGYTILYDTHIHGGANSVMTKTVKSLGGRVGEVVKGKTISEVDFLHKFLDERRAWLFDLSKNDKQEAQKLNQEADALKRKADELKKEADSLQKQNAKSNEAQVKILNEQAAAKRAEAERWAAEAESYASNSRGLEAAAKSTRCFVLDALVDSGNLDLLGNDKGEIHLAGDSTRVIRGLKPGATVDEISQCLVEQPIPKEPPMGNKILEKADEIVAGGLASEAWRLIELVAETELSASDADVEMSVDGNDRSKLAQVFEVVARPGDAIRGRSLKQGDIVIRLALCEGVKHAFMLASELMPMEDLPNAHMVPESSRFGTLPGFYVKVIEGGPKSHLMKNGFARRLADETGHVLKDSLIIRLINYPHSIIKQAMTN